jgi:predicted butyrate kinase (DUF1464 family)
MRAIEKQRRRRGCADAVASESGLGLLVGRKRNLAQVGGAHADVIHTTEDERSRAIVRRAIILRELQQNTWIRFFCNPAWVPLLQTRRTVRHIRAHH